MPRNRPVRPREMPTFPLDQFLAVPPTIETLAPGVRTITYEQARIEYANAIAEVVRQNMEDMLGTKKTIKIAKIKRNLPEWF